jgi:hypothetical protein
MRHGPTGQSQPRRHRKPLIDERVHDPERYRDALVCRQCDVALDIDEPYQNGVVVRARVIYSHSAAAARRRGRRFAGSLYPKSLSWRDATIA